MFSKSAHYLALPSTFAMYEIRSSTRLEYPLKPRHHISLRHPDYLTTREGRGGGYHSLSYHEMSLTKCGLRTMPAAASKMLLASWPLRSLDTRASSE